MRTSWDISKVMDFFYIHRFDLMQTNGNQNLFFIYQPSLNGFETEIIDVCVGASNITVYEKNQHQYIASANRETNKIAIYKTNKGER